MLDDVTTPLVIVIAGALLGCWTVLALFASERQRRLAELEVLRRAAAPPAPLPSTPARSAAKPARKPPAPAAAP